MGLFKWVKRWIAGPPDVLYVPEPPCQLTKDLSAELKRLKERADKRRLLNTMKNTQDILEDLESRIHADADDPARSIMG